MSIQFQGLPTNEVANARHSGRDIYGLPIETATSSGTGIPCRHCLKTTPRGATYLILAWRPFAGLTPYTETGPIFLCAESCTPADASPDLPEMLTSPSYIVRGYSSDERIVYGTGKVIPTPDIPAYAAQLLSNPDVGFVDIRSASNNCFQCRVVRAG